MKRAIKKFGLKRPPKPVLSSSPFQSRADEMLLQKPSKADWAFCPPAWDAKLEPASLPAVISGDTFGYKTQIFHNAKNAEISARQQEGRLGAQHSPYSVQIRFDEFNGTYISFAISLPLDILTHLSRRNLIDIGFAAICTGVERAFVRLNVENGPNSDQSVQEVELGTQAILAGFDLSKFHFNVGSTQKIWIDISFDCREKGDILLHDLLVFRRIRAAI